MFKLKSSSKYFPFDVLYLWRHFFYCSKQFLNSSILMPFSASAFFCFTSSTSAKYFPLRTFFHQGKPKKSLGDRDGKIGWMGRMGHGGHDVFDQKCWTLIMVWTSARKSPIMKWVNTLKESSKKLIEAEHSLSQQRQLVHWYRWIPRKLA